NGEDDGRSQRDERVVDIGEHPEPRRRREHGEGGDRGDPGLGTQRGERGDARGEDEGGDGRAEHPWRRPESPQRGAGGMRGRPTGPRGPVVDGGGQDSLYPAPRTVTSRSAPILRRSVRTYTSTTLEAGSKSYPQAWARICSRERT